MFFVTLLLWFVAIVIVGILLALLLNSFINFQQQRVRKKEKRTVLAVRVSKLNENGPKVAEQIFATFHGVGEDLSLWQKLKGQSTPQISFEIANVNRLIRFYVVFPSKLRNLIEGQIYAQYPDVEIFEVEDYAQGGFVDVASAGNTKQDEKVAEKGIVQHDLSKSTNFTAVDVFKNAVGAELALSDTDIQPIKRYPQFEDMLTRLPVDPIAGITATFSQFSNLEDQAWMQIVFRPLPDKWRIVFTKCVKILDKGAFMNIENLQRIYTRAFCTRVVWKRIVFFPLYIFFFFQGLKVGGKNLRITADGVQSGGSDKALDEELSTQHTRETSSGAMIDKVIRLLFEASVRVVVVSNGDKEAARVKVKEIAGSFSQFSLPHLNSFEIVRTMEGSQIVDDFRNRKMITSSVFSNEELATVYHLPHMSVHTPNIDWVKSRKLEPPGDLPTVKQHAEGELTLIGKSNFRGQKVQFGVRNEDRRRHLYIIGKTGMGKSTLLENMIFSDIQAGKGVAVVDPHGDLAEAVLDFVPSSRTNDVIMFDPGDRDFPVGFNMLESVNPALSGMVCSGLVGIFKKIYAESWGPRLEHILRNTILALLEYPNSTMLGIVRMLQDNSYRKKVVANVTDPVVKAFWEQEFASMTDKFRVEAISPILNKVGQFLSSPVVRNIVGQPKSMLDLRFAMDKGKIIIVNLSKGRIGEDNSSLLGAMMITKFQLDAMSRADVPENERKDFYLYVDEFQNFATDSFATILSEARKYRLNLTMANQYIAQMPEEVRDAVFGNVGSLLSFQVGFDDAEYISKQYGEEVLPNDLVALSKYTSYMRLLIDGMPSKTFSLDTLEPPSLIVEDGRREKIVKVSRERYAQPREMVEDKILKWSATAKALPAKSLVSSKSATNSNKK